VGESEDEILRKLPAPPMDILIRFCFCGLGRERARREVVLLVSSER
jgi:hypothetical protein